MSAVSVTGQVYALTGEELAKWPVQRRMVELTYEYGKKKLNTTTKFVRCD